MSLMLPITSTTASPCRCPTWRPMSTYPTCWTSPCSPPSPSPAPPPLPPLSPTSHSLPPPYPSPPPSPPPHPSPPHPSHTPFSLGDTLMNVSSICCNKKCPATQKKK